MRITVIGAGPAGSVAAILLARRGACVTLVEQSTFPRDKVCGECVSSVGLAVLARHGLFDALQTVGVTLTHTRLVGADQLTTTQLPKEMLGITRRAMDVILLQSARDAGVMILQPARVEAIDAKSVAVRMLSDNRTTTLASDYVVVADGRGTGLGNRPPLTGDMGIKCHYESIAAPAHTITLYSTNGTYGGVAPVEGERWNVAFSVPAERLKHAGGDVGRVFEEMIRANPVMSREFSGARRTGEWLAAPLPRYGVRRDWPQNVIPVGNAAAAIEPIGGEGMGMAIASAELCAQAICDDDVAGLRARYESLWGSRVWSCRAGAVAMSNRYASDFLVGLSELPSVARMGFGLVGKFSK